MYIILKRPTDELSDELTSEFRFMVSLTNKRRSCYILTKKRVFPKAPAPVKNDLITITHIPLYPFEAPSLD